ncbi:NADPH-dependent FMN reductase [Antarcticimicrobium luteum]|uniref:NAD(P)H-dependent oxidoreductase n=1 Tax=Antarcticimicrobium luteum TaxID=2547397 RepID=A0A4R5V4L4_9RHOB|nr:NADPH-dependent FMN reductase [Antarcticimicrobium luteum]TDK46852.1 NAD(P)H-dependent oxidoreductase [Antarcticimicrobium luteum]
MKLLAVSGSARRASTNTALLRAVAAVAPQGIEISVFDGVGQLPVFSPDLEEGPPPPSVQALMEAIAQSDGLILSSPEYVHAIPGGLKNAIDWLVSGEHIIGKPVALMHASHRGDDMLAALRLVLSTVTERFAPEIFLRLPLMKMTPGAIMEVVGEGEYRAQAVDFLEEFAAYCRTVAG